MPHPSGFSLKVINFVRTRLREADADLSGRYLATHTQMSSSYARERLVAAKPFNTEDIEQMATAFGYRSSRDFVIAAIESEPNEDDIA